MKHINALCIFIIMITTISFAQNGSMEWTTERYLTIISPNGGEYWAGGSNKTIIWQAAGTNFDHFQLLLSRNSGASYDDTISDNVAATESTYNWLIPLLNYNTCRVMVQMVDTLDSIIANDASYSNFTIDSDFPLTPNLILPINGSNTRDSMPRFWWHCSFDSLSGIDHYVLVYSRDSSFVSGVVINTTDTTYQVTTRLVDSTYYWSVEAVDRAGNFSDWSPTWRFEIDTRIPNTPNLISPINGVWQTNTTAIFHWSQVILQEARCKMQEVGQGFSPASKESNPKGSPYKNLSDFASPVRYILQVDTSRNFTNPIIDTTGLLYDTLVLSQAKYFWRVRAFDLAGNQGIFCGLDSFGIDYTAPSVPTLISPANGAIVNSFDVTFIWRRSSDNLSGVSSYTLQGALDPFFLLSIDTIVTDTIFTVNLPYDTTIYWRVRSHDRAGNQSNWSSTRYFTIRTSGIEENSKIESKYLMFDIRPNPTKSDFNIYLTLSSPSEVSLSVYDDAGKLVKTIFNGSKQAGNYSMRWNGKDQHNKKVGQGIYFYTLKVNDKCLRKKVMLLR